MRSVVSAALRAAAATAIGTLLGGPAVGGELRASVRGEAGQSLLRVSVDVPADAAVDGRLRLRLPERYPLESAGGADGRPLPVTRIGDTVAVERLAPGEAHVTLRYRWLLERRLEEMRLVVGLGWLPLPEGATSAAGPVALDVALPAPLVAISTGQVERSDEGASARFVWRDPAAGAAAPLVLGRLSWHERRSGDRVSRVFLPEGLEARRDALLDLVEASSGWFGNTFGFAPRRDFALAAVPMPRGRHGLALPGLSLVASEDLSVGAILPERILAHELAHNWWTHTVRFPAAPDAWLREGLPTYSAMLFLEYRDGATRLREELSNSRRIALGAVAPPPLSSLGETPSPEGYTQGYHKAAVVLHMLRAVVGREAFSEGLADLIEAHHGTDASAGDLMALLQARSGADLVRFRADWIDKAAVPRFEVSWRALSESGRVAGTIRQQGADVRLPKVRMVLEHVDASTTEVRLALQGAETAFEMDAGPSPTRLLFDPDGDLLSAGVDVRAEAEP